MVYGPVKGKLCPFKITPSEFTKMSSSSQKNFENMSCNSRILSVQYTLFYTMILDVSLNPLYLTVMSPKPPSDLFSWYYSFRAPTRKFRKQKVSKLQNGPPTCPSKKNSGGQGEEGPGVFHHLQQKYQQSYFMHHYQNEFILNWI